jgi:hypothetical protein
MHLHPHCLQVRREHFFALWLLNALQLSDRALMQVFPSNIHNGNWPDKRAAARKCWRCTSERCLAIIATDRNCGPHVQNSKYLKHIFAVLQTQQ